jgi:hydroxymethylpyrimidine kinase/phosphomethylpyrimidine kinase
MTAAVLSIGCTEPWNAAGLGLDIRALSACGVRPLSVVAGVTAQDARGVHAASPVPTSVLTAQLASLADARLGAIRIGALLDGASVRAVAEFVRATNVPAVYDPVLAPSGGGRFGDDATLAAIVAELVPAVALVTPNLDEAATLTRSTRPVTIDDMERAAARLRELGAGAALITGGHREGDATDVLVDSSGTVAYDAPRIAGTLRGSGCLLACGIAASLAQGATLRQAIERGRGFVRERFANGVEAGGMRVAY